MSKPRVLLTGATGFIGSHLLEALLKQGYPVIVLKRSSSKLWRIEHLAGKYKSYDIDTEQLQKVFKDQKVDLVIHLSTLYNKVDLSSDVSGMVMSNICFPSEILIQSVEQGVKGFINTGTFFEYDCSNQPVSEESLAKAFNFYAKTKLAFESILKTYASELCINTFKIFSPFGEKDNFKLVPFIIKKSLSNESIKLSDGMQKIDFIYIRDIVDAYIKAIERMINVSYQPEFEVFNLGSGVPLSIRDIVSVIEDCMGRRLDVSWGPASVKDIPVAYADIKKIHQYLGWLPSYSTKEGLLNTINYLREQKDEYN